MTLIVMQLVVCLALFIDLIKIIKNTAGEACNQALVILAFMLNLIFGISLFVNIAMLARMRFELVQNIHNYFYY